MAKKTPAKAPNKTGAAAQAKPTSTTVRGDHSPHIVFHAQYIKDLSFENPNPPSAAAGTPHIQINCSVTSKPLKDKPRHYEIILMLAVTAKQEDKVMFIAELTYGGLMSVGDGVDDKAIHPLVMIEGPRHLFPFARMLMNSIVREGGFLPLNIQPIDFVRLYQQRMQQMQAAKASSTASSKTGAKNGAAQKNGKG